MLPSELQLKQTIAQGDDSVNNVLILRLDGEFELVKGAGAGAVSHLDYVTRYETFDKGNDYVGPDAAEDQSHIDWIMDWAKEAWSRYQATGGTKITNPYG